MNPNPNGAKLVGSETTPLLTGASVAYALAKIYSLFVTHEHWWELDESIFGLLGALIFFGMRRLNTLALHKQAYDDELRQAQIAAAWAVVPIPVQLLIEWAKQRQPNGAPPEVPKPVPSTPVGPGRSVSIDVPKAQNSPSIPAAESGGYSLPDYQKEPPPLQTP